MPRSLLFLPLLAMLLTAGVAPLSAQREGDPDLYIPPVLTVSASAHMMTTIGLLTGMPAESVAMEEAVSIRQERSVETDLLLPMIFFEPASSTIPERYALFTGSSDADDYSDTSGIRPDLGEESLPKYHEIVNVIGFRLRSFPSTTITLEGGYSTEPGETAAIGHERAAVVKEYLVRIWRIAPERIAILPSRRACDSTDHAFRQEEARRVVIESESWLIHRPVRYYLSRIAHPMMLLMFDVDPKESPHAVANLHVTITSGDEVLGASAVPVSTDGVRIRSLCYWNLPRNAAALDEGLTFYAVLTMADGTRRASAPVTLPVRIIAPTPEDRKWDTIALDHLRRRIDEEEEEEEVEEQEIPQEEVNPQDMRTAEELEEARKALEEAEKELATLEAEEEEDDAYDAEEIDEYDDEEVEDDPEEPLEEDEPYGEEEMSVAEEEDVPLTEDEELALQMAYEENLTTVGFFGGGEPLLRRHQQLMIEQCAVRFTGDSAETQYFSWTIVLQPHGEEGDDPDIDHARIAIKSTNERNRRMMSKSLYVDPTFLTPIVPVATVGDLMEDRENLIFRLDELTYGEHARTINAWKTHDRFDTIAYTESEWARIDSVLTPRAETVARYIHTSIRNGLYDSIMIAPARRRRGRLPMRYLPEERFYERMVTVERRRRSAWDLPGEVRWIPEEEMRDVLPVEEVEPR